MTHNLTARLIHATTVSRAGIRFKSFHIQCRPFAGMMKQHKIPVVTVESAEIIDVDGMKLDMALQEMQVMSSYLDTYEPILKELRNNLNDVNNQYVQKSISIHIGRYILKNKAAHTAQIKITELADDIKEISEKLNTFCNRVNNVSSDNFDKLFENVHRLSHKCKTEVVTKQRIIDALNEQQELVANMKQDINAWQIHLEETQKQLRDTTEAYDKLKEKYQSHNSEIYDDIDRLNEVINQMQKRYQKYKKRYSIGFFVCTAMTVTAAVLFYYLYEQEIKSRQNIMQIYQQELGIRQDSVEEMTNVYMIEKMKLEESDTTKQQLENSLIEKDDMLMKKTQQIEKLKEELNVASKRGLWSYIFG